MSNKDRAIYLDYAASTPLNEKAYLAMQPFFLEHYANPAGIYQMATKNYEACEEARKQIAKIIGASPSEIYFTSGGTESDNWALTGTALARKNQGNHIIISAIEHHAVMETARFLENFGFEVTILPVDPMGKVSKEALKKALRDDTILLSIMHANNEIGTIQDISSFAEIIHAKDGCIPTFHTDAVQSVGHIDVNVERLGVDLLSASAHKFGGPKGVGFLYIRENTKIEALLHGGKQERKLRGGTLNVAGIVGMAAALKEAVTNMEEKNKRLWNLRELFFLEVTKQTEGIFVNGYPFTKSETPNRLPGNLNLRVLGALGEQLVLFGNYVDLCFSTGAACTTGDSAASLVLLALGLTKEEAKECVRLSFGDDLTEDDVMKAAKRFAETVNKVRMLFGK